MADNKTSIVLTADDKTRAAFDSARRNLDGLTSVAGKLNSVLGAVGVGASLGGLATFVKGSIDAADNMRDLAIATGTSVEALARYQLAAKQSGTDIETVAKAMGKLSVYMAKNSEEAASLGITARDPAQALAQLADVLAQVEDPAQRNALAMNVLGRGYADFMPLLAQGGDELRKQADAAGPYAKRMADLADKADRFNDSLAALAQQGSAALLPMVDAFLDMADAATQAAEGLEGVDAALAGLGQAGTVGQTVAVVWANVAYVFEQVGTEIGGIAAQIAALARGDFQGAGSIGKMMKEDAAKARAELDALEKRIMTFKATARAPSQSGAKAKTGGAFDVAGIIGDDEAGKMQKTLAKAFDTKPLDDYLLKFQDRRQKIVAEYAKLKADLTGPDTSQASDTPYTDLSYELTKGRGALAAGDAVGAGIAAERAKAMLESNKDQLGSSMAGYFAEQIKAYELSIVDAEEKAATAAADALKRSLDQAAQEVAAMDPVHVPLATDAIAADMRATIETIRRELEANPLRIPVQVTGGGLSGASLAVGAR